ncbi:hypothetical protein WJX79_010273 [Trebouxia sp. C0005]
MMPVGLLAAAVLQSCPGCLAVPQEHAKAARDVNHNAAVLHGWRVGEDPCQLAMQCEASMLTRQQGVFSTQTWFPASRIKLGVSKGVKGCPT